ncbi:hypothetical protein ACFIJ5_11160 [Haloimpatiens sp. FM7330]|uniref:hypothetical protein n=1 Tax=Haloimpatiens sp. FM7330 TaxID=3298610 RepID=UPI003626D58A
MYRCKKLKKGFILVYVMLVGMLLLNMATYCFLIEMDNKKVNNYKMDFFKKKDLEVDKREYILTKLKAYILANVKPLDNNTINEYFKKEELEKKELKKSNEVPKSKKVNELIKYIQNGMDVSMKQYFKAEKIEQIKNECDFIDYCDKYSKISEQSVKNCFQIPNLKDGDSCVVDIYECIVEGENIKFNYVFSKNI